MDIQKTKTTIINIFKTLFLTMVLALLSAVLTKKDIAFYIFILSITNVLIMFVLFDSFLGFFSVVIFSIFIFFGIYLSITLLFPPAEDFYKRFDLLIKISTIIIILIVRYLITKKKLTFSTSFEISKMLFN